MSKLLIIGSGGLARELTDWCASHFEIVGYSSPTCEEYESFALPGRHYGDDVSPDKVGTKQALIAIGHPSIKERVYINLRERGFQFPSFVHSSAVVSSSARLAEGAIIAPNCVIGPSVSIGKCAYINFSVGIGHDAQIGDFVQINPGAQIGGFANIGNGVLVGSGATVLHRISVGQGTIVGTGAVCFVKIGDSMTVMGNPARKLKGPEGP